MILHGFKFLTVSRTVYFSFLENESVINGHLIIQFYTMRKNTNYYQRRNFILQTF